MALSPDFVRALNNLSRGDSSSMGDFTGGLSAMTGAQLVDQQVQQKREEEKQNEENSIEAQVEKQKEEKEERQTKKMEGLDWLFGKAGQIAEGINSISGMDKAMAHVQNEGITPENIGRLAGSFALSIPTMFASMPFDIASKGYEALTGKPVTESHDDYMADYELSPEQRIASGAEAAFLGAMPFTGGLGGGVKGLAKIGGTMLTKDAEKLAAKEAFNVGKKEFLEDANLAVKTGINAVEGGGFGLAGAYRGDQETAEKGGPTNEEILSGVGQGALMGGAMGLAGRGIEKLGEFVKGEHNSNLHPEDKFDKGTNADPALDTATPLTDISNPYKPSEAAAESSSLTTINRLIDSYKKKDNKIDSTSSAILYGDANLRGDEAQVSIGSIAKLMNNEKEEAAQSAANNIAQAFGHENPEKLLDLAHQGAEGRDKLYTELDNALQAKKQNNEAVEIAAYKEPAQKDKGSLNLRLANITKDEGNQMSVHQSTLHQFTADVDGDANLFTFRPEIIKRSEKPFENLLVGFDKSALDYSEYNLGKNNFMSPDKKLNTNAIENVYRSALEESGLYDRTNANGQTFVDYLQGNRNKTLDDVIDEIVTAYGHEENNDIEISRSLQNLYNDIKKWDGRNSASETMGNILIKEGPNRKLFSAPESHITKNEDLVREANNIDTELRNKTYKQQAEQPALGKSKITDVTVGAIKSEGIGHSASDIATSGNQDFRGLTIDKYGAKKSKNIQALSSITTKDEYRRITNITHDLYENGQHDTNQFKNIRNQAIFDLFENSNDRETPIVTDNGFVQYSIDGADVNETFIDDIMNITKDVTEIQKDTLKQKNLSLEDKTIDGVPYWQEYQILHRLGGKTLNEKVSGLYDVLMSDYSPKLDLHGERLTFNELVQRYKYFQVDKESLNTMFGKNGKLGDIVETLMLEERRKKNTNGGAIVKKLNYDVQEFVKTLKTTTGEFKDFDIKNKYHLDALQRLTDSSSTIVGPETHLMNGIIYKSSILDHQYYEKFNNLVKKNATAREYTDAYNEALMAERFTKIYKDLQTWNIDIESAMARNDMDAFIANVDGAFREVENIIANVYEAGGNDCWGYVSELYRARINPIKELLKTNSESIKDLKSLENEVYSFTRIIEQFLRVDKDSYGFYEKINNILREEMLRDLKTNQYEKITIESFIHDMIADPDQKTTDVGAMQRITASKEFIRDTGKSSFLARCEQDNKMQMRKSIEGLNSQYGEATASEILEARLKMNTVDINTNVIPQAFVEALLPSGKAAEKASAQSGIIAYDLAMSSIKNVPMSVKRFIQMNSQGRIPEILETDLATNTDVIRRILSDSNFVCNIKDANGHTHTLNQETFFKEFGIEIGDRWTTNDLLKLNEQIPIIADLFRDTKVGKGNPRTPEAISIQTSDANLTNVLWEFAQDYMNNDKAPSREKFSRIVRNEVMDASDFAEIYARRMMTFAKKSELTLENIYDKSRQATEDTMKIWETLAAGAFGKKELERMGVAVTDDYLKDKIIDNMLESSLVREQARIDALTITQENTISREAGFKKATLDCMNSLTQNELQASIDTYLMKNALDNKVINSNQYNKGIKEIKQNYESATSENISNLERYVDRILNVLALNEECNMILHKSSGVDDAMFNSIIKRFDLSLDYNYLSPDIRESISNHAQNIFGKNGGLQQTFEKALTDSIGSIYKWADTNDISNARNADSLFKILSKKMKKDTNNITFDISHYSSGEAVYSGCLDERLYNLADNFYKGYKNLSDSQKAEATDALLLSINQKIADKRMSKFVNDQAQNKISFANAGLVRNSLERLYDKAADFYTQATSLNNGTNLSDFLGNQGQFDNEFFNSYTRNLKTNFVDLDLLSDIGELNTRSIVDQFGAAGNPTNVGVSGNTPVNMWAFEYCASKLDPMLRTKIEVTSKKPEEALTIFANQLCNYLFMPSVSKEASAYEPIRFTEGNEVAAGNYSSFDRYIANQDILIQANNAIRNALNDPNATGWTSIGKEQARLLIDYLRSHPGALTSEEFFVNTGLGSVPKNSESLLAYIMEPRILQGKKNPFEMGESYIPNFSGVDGINTRSANVHYTNPEEAINSLINFRNEFSETYRENLRQNIFNNKVDKEKYPGILKTNDGEYTSIAPGVFDILTPWIDLTLRDEAGERNIRLSVWDLDKARWENRPIIDPITKEPLDFTKIIKQEITIQNPETINDMMLRVGNKAYAENPNIDSATLIDKMKNVLTNPPEDSFNPRSLSDIINDNITYNRRGNSSGLAYMKYQPAFKDIIEGIRYQDQRSEQAYDFQIRYDGMTRNLKRTDTKDKGIFTTFKDIVSQYLGEDPREWEALLGKDRSYVNMYITDQRDLAGETFGINSGIRQHLGNLRLAKTALRITDKPEYNSGLAIIDLDHPTLDSNQWRTVLVHLAHTDNNPLLSPDTYKSLAKALNEQGTYNINPQPHWGPKGKMYFIDLKNLKPIVNNKNSFSPVRYNRDHFSRAMITEDWGLGPIQMADSEVLWTNSANPNHLLNDTLEYNLPELPSTNGKPGHLASSTEELRALANGIADKTIDINLDAKTFEGQNKTLIKKCLINYLKTGLVDGNEKNITFDNIKGQSVIGAYVYTSGKNRSTILPIFYEGQTLPITHGNLIIEKGLSNANKIILDMYGTKPISKETITDSFGRTWTKRFTGAKSVSGDFMFKGNATKHDITIYSKAGHTAEEVIPQDSFASRLLPNSSSIKSLRIGSLIMNMGHNDKRIVDFSLTDKIRKTKISLSDSERLALLSKNSNFLNRGTKEAWIKFIDNDLDKLLATDEVFNKYTREKQDWLRNALHNRLHEMVANNVNPLWFFDKDICGTILPSGPAPIQSVSAWVSDYEDLCSIYNWLTTIKGKSGDDIVDFYGKVVANPTKDKKVPLFNGDEQLEDIKIIHNGQEYRDQGYMKSYWKLQRFAEKDTLHSNPTDQGNLSLAQMVTNLCDDKGSADIKRMLELTSLKKQNPQDQGIYRNILETSVKEGNFNYRPTENKGIDVHNIPRQYYFSRLDEGERSGLIKFISNQKNRYGRVNVWSTTEENVTHDQNSFEVRSGAKEVANAFGWNTENEMAINDSIEFIKHIAGDTGTESGPDVIPFDVWVEAKNKAVQYASSGKLPGITAEDVVWPTTNAQETRIMIPITERGLLTRICNSDHFGRSYEDVKAELIPRVKELANKVDLYTTGKRAQNKLYEYAYDKALIDLGESIDSLRYWGNQRWRDVNATGINVREAGFGARNGDPAMFKDLQTEANLRRAAYAEFAKKRGWEIIKDENAKNGQYIIRRINEDGSIAKVFRTGSLLSRVFGVLDPGVFIQNAVDKQIGLQGERLLLKWAGIEGRAGYKLSDELLEKLARDPQTTAFFNAWHMATYNGDELGFIRAMQSGNIQAREYISKMKSLHTNFEKAYNQVMKLSTAEPLWTYRRNKNAIQMFLKTAAEDGHKYLEEPVVVEGHDNPMTYLQAFVTTNINSPERILSAMFLGGHDRFNTDLAGRKAWNITLKGDLAQNNVVNWFFEQGITNSSLPDFLMCTLGNKYFRAATNTMGRTLNWVAPTSTLNYVAAKLMASDKFIAAAKEWRFMPKGIKEYMEIPEVFKAEMDVMKGYNSIREALILDAMHMSVPMLATMLAGAAFFEPPEDPNKANNYEEWTICGLRIGQNWWLDDILGVAAPLAAFWKSAEMGNPDINIYLNGISHHLANNPFLKIGDCIGAVMNVDHSLDEAESIANMYEKAPDGAPDLITYSLGSIPALSLSYFSQFITPAFLKNLDRTMKQYEVSYNRIYKVDANGNKIIDENGTPETTKTTFADAQIRKVCRNNPVLGTIMNLLPTGSQTSYVGAEMPRQVFYEPSQMVFMKKYSVLDENGNEKSDKEKNIIAAQLITMLASSNDMKELRKQGFMLDYETKKYVSEVLHDMYQLTKDDFNEKKNSGALDYSVLGNGNYAEGKKIYSQYYQAYQDQLNYWQSLYRDKLYSKDLNQGIQKYNRFNTTYLQDKQGNWYATGMREGLGGLLSPLKYGPPETGKANDYASQSALTGGPLFDPNTGNPMRGLIAAPNDDYNTPAIESWGKEYNNGYSSNYSSSGSYGSYARRSGGGGGGGGSRSIHSTSPSLNISKPTTSRQANIRSTQYDYLRPNYEVKGTRKARTYNSV